MVRATTNGVIMYKVASTHTLNDNALEDREFATAAEGWQALAEDYLRTDAGHPWAPGGWGSVLDDNAATLAARTEVGHCELPDGERLRVFWQNAETVGDPMTGRRFRYGKGHPDVTERSLGYNEGGSTVCEHGDRGVVVKTFDRWNGIDGLRILYVRFDRGTTTHVTPDDVDWL